MLMGDAMFTRLSSWSQMAPRAYVRFALCFPLADNDRMRTIVHLRAALARLCSDHPDLAGGLRIYGWFDTAAVWLQNGKPGQEIRLDTHDMSTDAGFEGAQSFEDLEGEGFAPGRFVGPTMGIPMEQIGEQPIPVVVVRAMFVRGGLLLAVYFHHTFGDGAAMEMFLRCFSAATRGEKEERPTSYVLDLPKHTDDHPTAPRESGIAHRHTYPLATWEQQLDTAPELALLDSMNGPAQPIQLPGGTPLGEIRSTGRIFVISQDAIQRLKRLIVDSAPVPCTANGTTLGKRRPPTTYTALAATVWAHMYEARMRTSAHHAPPDVLEQNARLVTPVDWRSRAFPDHTANYFGNAILQVVTEVPTANLRMAAGRVPGDSQDDDEDEDERDAGADVVEADADTALSNLVAEIQTTINGVDDRMIRRRTELFDAIRDHRKVGLAFEVRAPQSLHFNSWRRFGGNTRWQFGDGRDAMEPAAVRRVQAAWNLGGALVMPARSPDAPYEICITLEEEAMEALCADERWMRWVSRVVGC